MTIKKLAISTSILLAMGLSSAGFADDKGMPAVVDGDAVSIECITKADVDKMTDEEKANLKLPVCEEIEKNAGATTVTK